MVLPAEVRYANQTTPPAAAACNPPARPVPAGAGRATGVGSTKVLSVCRYRRKNHVAVAAWRTKKVTMSPARTPNRVSSAVPAVADSGCSAAAGNPARVARLTTTSVVAFDSSPFW